MSKIKIVFTQDLLPQNLIGRGVQSLKKSLVIDPVFDHLLDVCWPQDITYGLNLQWPGINGIIVPKSHTMLISFHTEQMDCGWLKNTAHCNPDSDIIVLYDGHVYPNLWWPTNVRFLRFITWHAQLENIISVWGKPKSRSHGMKHSVSALSFRCTQLKTYIVSSLLNHVNKNNFLLSWHVVPGYSTDTHSWNGTGRKKLDILADNMLLVGDIRADEWYNIEHNHPMQNSNCDHPAYQDCAFNITNESFHYSFSMMDGIEFIYPGPYFTEKTWKPLLAGNGIICAGQWQSYVSLKELGFRFDYGIDLSYDNVKEDLDRMCALIDVIDSVAEIDSARLEEISNESGLHNQDHILSGSLYDLCQSKNINHIKEILR